MSTIIEGVVTKVNHDVLFIELNSGVHKLYFWKIYLANSGSIQLPTLGSHLETHVSCDWFDAVYLMLEPHSVLIGEFQQSDYPNRLLELMKNRKCSDNELIIAMETYEKLRNWLPSAPKVVEAHDLLYEILTDNKIYNIKFLTQFEFVYPSSNFMNFHKRNSFYSHETHWLFEDEKNEALIGYLTTNSKTGLTEFTDFSRSVRCLITNQIDIRPLLHQFIRILDCLFIVEVFNGEKGMDFSEYILVNSEKIKVLQSQSATLETSSDDDDENRANFVFTLLSKGRPSISSILTPTGTGTVTFNVKIKYRNNEKHVTLNASKNPFDTILTNSDYIIYGHVSPITVCWTTAELQLLRIGTNPPIKTPEEAIQLMKVNSQRIVSFKAKIESKFFYPPSFARRSFETKGFGTPGNKTHVLNIYTTLRISKLYLNDFEPSPTPLGLIPNMVVIFRNIVYANTYFKFSTQSCFEIVEYVPPFKFQSANFLTEPISYQLYEDAVLHITDSMNIWISFYDFFLSGGQFQLHPITEITMTIIGKHVDKECKILCSNQAAEKLFWILIGPHLKDKFSTIEENFTFKPNGIYENDAGNCLIAEIRNLLSRCSARINAENGILYFMCRRLFTPTSPNAVFTLIDSKVKYDEYDDY